MGGGGGDGGYQARQDEIDRKKQAARAQLNTLFGVSSGVAAPVQSKPSGVFGQLRGMFPSEDGQGMGDQTGMGPDPAAANKAARDTLYTQVRDNAFTAGKRGLDERKTDAGRQNKFALFAQGLAGGSEDIDQNALLDRTYKQGLLDLGAKADSAKTDMMGNDEQTRLGLLQSIDAGMDEGSALSSALNQMKVNSERAASAAQGTSVGDLFGTAGLLYQKSNAARGAQDAGAWWQNYNRSNPSGMRNAGQGGIISKVGV